MIEQINHIASLWWSATMAMFWQVGVLIIVIGCVDLIIRKWAWPQLRYALWLMVLVKLILPPTISLSTSVTSGLEPLAKQIVAQENRRENLYPATATILTNFENTLAESPVETLSSRDIVTEQPPAVVFTGFENVAGQSLNAIHIRPVWQAYAMAVWLTGMLILGGWLIIKLLHLRKADRRLATTASLPESFHTAIARCAKSLGLRRIPKVVLTQKVACPAVFGLVRPVLLMPVGYLSKMTRKDTEHMLLHEFAHIKRGDLWLHGFYMLLQVVYWYNPLLWLVRSQMHHLRELCCDATVARLLKERISEYRQTLIDVARRFLTKPTEPGLGLLGLFEDTNRLLVRLNWLKKETWRYQKMKKLTIITTIALMLAFVLPMAQAQDKPAESSSTKTTTAKEQPSQSTNNTEVEQKLKQDQEELSRNLKELEIRLQQLQIQKRKLETQLQVMTRARQAESQAAQAKIMAKEAAIKAKDAALKANNAALKAKDAALKAHKEKDKDNKCVATREMHFVAKVKSGIPFIVRNSLGNITLKPSKDDTCDVKAVIRAKAETVAEAQKMVEQVSMDVNSSDDRYYLKPVKPDGDKWKNINVDFYIAVPVGIRPDVKTDLGNIDLSDLKGDIKALTNLGNVKAVNTAGNVDLHTDLGNVEFIAPKDMAGGDVKLVTNLGNIEFTAPKELSAKLRVDTKMGEIKSELPLEISKPDMFKRTTEGTIGSGQANINMTTNMGKINLKWQSSSKDETKL
jgi:beta-lactamase regulating signal transducer with metallopeptidase domain